MLVKRTSDRIASAVAPGRLSPQGAGTARTEVRSRICGVRQGRSEKARLAALPLDVGEFSHRAHAGGAPLDLAHVRGGIPEVHAVGKRFATATRFATWASGVSELSQSCLGTRPVGAFFRQAPAEIFSGVIPFQPQLVDERVGDVASSSPRPSRETGKDTDFVVIVSDEPQGALKI